MPGLTWYHRWHHRWHHRVENLASSRVYFFFSQKKSEFLIQNLRPVLASVFFELIFEEDKKILIFEQKKAEMQAFLN